MHLCIYKEWSRLFKNQKLHFHECCCREKRLGLKNDCTKRLGKKTNQHVDYWELLMQEDKFILMKFLGAYRIAVDNMLLVVMIPVFNFLHRIKRIVRIENSFNSGN
jgi:hypothetical protein